MKRIFKYIGTMYRPAYITLTLGLSIFSAGLCALAVTMRDELLSGARGISLIYAPMLEELLFPLILLIIVTLGVDAAERIKKQS